LENFDNLAVIVYLAIDTGKVYIKYDEASTNYSFQQIKTEVERIALDAYKETFQKE
jgi:hypothetical protein